MSELRKYERLQLIRGGLLRGLVGLVGFGLLLVGTGCISIDLLSGGGSEMPLVESVIRGNTGPKILLVDIDGVIGVSKGVGSLFGGDEYSMVARVREVLDRARDVRQRRRSGDEEPVAEPHGAVEVPDRSRQRARVVDGLLRRRPQRESCPRGR